MTSTRSFVALMLAAGAAAIALFILHLGLGTVWIPPDRVVLALVDGLTDPTDRTIVWDLRLPRAILGLLVGCMLGLSGALLQVVMRNRLAEPGLTGVSTGGILAAVLFLAGTWGLPQPGRLLPFVVLLGALAGGILVLFASSARGRIDPIRLILTAVIVNAILGSLTAIVMLRSSYALGNILSWLIGSLHGRIWDDVWLALPWAVVGVAAGLLAARAANLLQLDDESGRALGLPLQPARVVLFGLAAVLAAGAVSVSGAIAFVGLMAPNAARAIVGADARRVLPLAALIGCVLLLAADLVAQSFSIRPPIPSSAYRVGLPVGAVLAVFGAPLLIFLIRRSVR
ncbi:FecCD family ABC transporter permease [Candidatus Spongiisocius sp.]|uniref:FecCD family ABC transporter permease n=1 Tax=Candidatus Spongiisocius sp. TaxID=3101273 RepID=UPI003B5C7774